MNPIRLITSFLVSALLFASANGTAADSPATPGGASPTVAQEPAQPPLTAEEQKIWSHLQDLFAASRLVNSKKADEKKTARAKMEGALDWDRVANDCIGKANAKKNAGSMGQFRGLLQSVILKTAYSRMDKFWEGTEFSLEKIEVKGNSAFVKAKFQVKGEPFSLDYYLARSGKWKIYDIAFEDLRYSSNINEQIDAFLKERPFKDLIEKLQKRSKELDA